jgi:hypothetical protein
VRKPEEKRYLGSPRCRWVDNIKMDLRDMEWIDLAEDRGQWKVYVNTPLGSMKN